MSNELNKEKLTAFIRGTLGCGCPDEVFETIESSRIAVGALPGAATRIVVGDTLLLYVVAPASIQELADTIAEVADSGRRDRDANRYNRFRLVVSDDSDEGGRAGAVAGFAREVGSDKKMHIHFVDAATILGLYEA
ncbi:MAG: hypothetical protein LJE58_13075 [Thiogranum sp.]|jgi:hypothetical protein|nr:hypothetical protein [Thiogranum sp.]